MRSSAVVLVCLYLKSFVLAQRFGGKSIIEHFPPLLLIATCKSLNIQCNNWP